MLIYTLKQKCILLTGQINKRELLMLEEIRSAFRPDRLDSSIQAAARPLTAEESAPLEADRA